MARLSKSVALARGMRCRSDRLSSRSCAREAVEAKLSGSLLREEDDGEAKLLGKLLLYEENDVEALVVELPRGMLTANATEGLEGSDEKGNIEVGNRASSTEVNISY